MEYPKRLIEVDLPIARISAHARREKDMRVAHIPSLHIYPAARPPAACRAVICAALWPDPVDKRCPQRFRDDSFRILNELRDSVLNGKLSEDQRSARGPVESLRVPTDGHDHSGLRVALLDFIAEFANWDVCTNRFFLSASRALTQSAHESLGGTPGTRPLVIDPFAGGGAIPLESLRVGADAFASDLSPIAVLINKIVLQYIPKYGARLAEELPKWCTWAQDRAKDELKRFYPHDKDGAVPVAYLWARTVKCEGPSCGAEVPLMRSFWLAKKARKVALAVKPDSRRKRLEFSVISDPAASQVPEGTVARGSATCPCCGYTTPAPSVRKQLSDSRGGSSSARLFVVVVDTKDNGRQFRIATKADVKAYMLAAEQLQQLCEKDETGQAVIPNESTPIGGGRGAGRAFSQRKYGIDRWEDIFNRRQLIALTTYARLCREYTEDIEDRGFAEALNACIALIIDRLADLNAALCVWQLNTPNTAHVFGRWALQITWDYGEVNPLAGAGGSPESAIRRMVRCIKVLSAAQLSPGHVEMASADNHPLPDDAAAAVVTDPPYYDAVPYSDLLDFFYVWLKRSLNGQLRSLVSEELGPKNDECILDEVKGKDKAYYESTMQRAMSEARRVLAPSGIGVVVFAHKSTSGWEAQLQAMVDAGLTITGSWPIDTEMGSRLRAKGSAALASSVHLVCRPRENPDGSLREDDVGDWRDVLAELPRRIHAWLPRLATEGVVGADAIFACIGPALEVFSRYSRVEKASGEIVTLGEYLEQVWAAVSKEALSLLFKDADASGLEPDARLTAMWLWTLGAGAGANGNGKASSKKDAAEGDEDASSGKAKTSGYVLEFDAARKIAQGLGAHLDKLSKVVEVKGDKARLLSVSERTRHLFGKDAEADQPRGRRKKKSAQMNLFEELEAAEEMVESGGWALGGMPMGKTALDRIHQAMILFAAGRGEALKRFLVEDGAGKDARFWKLAQALSALYPAGTDEKRWVDGVLGRKKGLGL